MNTRVVKLKRQPEDFQVEELTAFAASGGPFALYRLTKRSLGTPEAIDAIVRRWDIARARISFGGLKDRHALTTQHVTIDRGPRRALRQSGFDLAYVGQAGRPFAPRDISANRFSIVMRDLSKEALARAESALADPAIPNYFDDQRFGSLGESGEYIGRAWCEERYERALWLALAEPNEHDRPDDRERKRILREKWGDWPACKAALDRSHVRSIVSFLADRPGDFKGALGRTRKEMRSLWLAAFQSFLWNRLLSDLVRESCRDAVPVELKSGTVLFPGSGGLPEIALPLPSARLKTADARLERVLAAEGIALRQLRIQHPKDSFFSKGERASLVRPAGLTHASGADELYPGRRKLSLRFDLPRGSYATILVKRLTANG